jgi:hypothetical protein
MTVRAIVDEDGEIVAIVSGNDAAIEHNTPHGCVALADLPPSPDAYRVGGAWNLRPTRPSAVHTWDRASKQWRDLRPLDVIRRDLAAPVLQLLADSDGAAIRPIAEIVAALMNGEPMPTASKLALAVES